MPGYSYEMFILSLTVLTRINSAELWFRMAIFFTTVLNYNLHGPLYVVMWLLTCSTSTARKVIPVGV